MSDYPDSWLKRPHADGCTGNLHRSSMRALLITVDRLGRVGNNGGIVAHDFRCNRSWAGCPARVIVSERAVRALAVDCLPTDEGSTDWRVTTGESRPASGYRPTYTSS